MKEIGKCQCFRAQGSCFLPAHRAAAAAASRWAVRTSGDGMGLYKALCYCSVVNING